MNTSAKATNAARRPAGFVTWALLALLAALMLFKLFCSIEGYPQTYCDELVYTEPPVNFVQNGHYASPGMARQAESNGLAGVDKNYFMFVPLSGYLRVACYELVGTQLPGLRVTDWFFLVAGAAALLFALRRRATTQAWLVAGIIFVTNRMAGCDFGRPDLLAAAFGLLAFALAITPQDFGADKKRLWGRAYVIGLCLGLSGLCHPFGGVFWGVTVVAAQIMVHGAATKPWRLMQWLFLLGLGGLTSLLLWLPQIAMAPQAWYQQFSFMLGVKYHMVKSFSQSAQKLASTTVVRNPAVALIIVVCPVVVGWRRLACPKLWRLLIVCLGLLAGWRCHAFEAVVIAYSIHFWAVICILFALAFDDLTSWADAKFSAGRAQLVRLALLVAVTAPGVVMNYIPAVETCVLPYRQVQQDIVAMLQKNLSPDDRVLAGDGLYYLVPSHRKTAWLGTEKLEVNDFDAVVAPFASADEIPVSDGKDRVQMTQCFTPRQAAVFRSNFELVTNIPAIYFRPRLYPTGYQPHVLGCYLYRNRQPHADPARPVSQPAGP